MIVHVHGKPVTLTPETIAATRAWYIDNARACIAEAREYAATGGKSGTRVNDIESYVDWREQSIRSMEQGDGDHTFAFIQRAVSIQTGECVPLLATTKSHPHA